MDLSFYDARQRAEEGAFFALKNPITREPFAEGDDAPGFVVRGVASRTVQQSLGAMQAKATKGGAKDDTAVMEAIHRQMIDSAMRYIVEARNIEWGGERVDSAEQIRRVLDSTFPDFQQVQDEDGKVLTQEVKDENGKTVTVPQFEMRNLPYAKQVIEAAEDSARFFETPAHD